MARRRQRAELVLPVMPPHLLDCVVEDWVTPAELYDPDFGRTGSTLDRDPNMRRGALRVTAARRCGQARAEWATENGLEWPCGYPVFGRPRFRDEAP